MLGFYQQVCTSTPTHTHTYIYIYIYIYVSLCKNINIITGMFICI